MQIAGKNPSISVTENSPWEASQGLFWHDELMTRLLMIDDDEKLAALVKDYLEPQGFEISTAFDGLKGLEAVRALRPALIILDLMLPGLDGLELCRRIREHSQVPILMLTARGDETDRVVGLEMGADDYLSKPFSPRELLARIRAVLRRAETPANPQSRIAAGPLMIDPAARTIAVSGHQISLTTAEFDLLLALAENKGRVLSRDQLMERVHGAAFDAYDRSIDVHISRIRQKIETDPKNPVFVKTIRGIGYQLAIVEH